MGEILEQARRTLRMEADAIHALADRLDTGFEQVVERIMTCAGRVVVTGMGKSGLIGRKIAATLASTGTPAFFMHPAEGSHGDLGMLTARDTVLAISNSGETPELVALLPVFKRLGVPIIAMTGRRNSTLGNMSDALLDVAVAMEACPLGVAPTCSTTVTLALGDALALALLEKRGFDLERFAQLHPGGSLGQRLLRKVAERMHTGAEVPLVRTRQGMREVLLEMTGKRMGMTGVVDDQGALAGIITDGDLRRHLERGGNLLEQTAGEVMTPNPRTIRADALVEEAIRRMENGKITSLFVTDAAGAMVGVIHLHDLLTVGVA